MNCPTCNATPAQMPCAHTLRARKRAPTDHTIDVLVCPTKGDVTVMGMAPTLRAMQRLVDGYIEGVTVLQGSVTQGPVKAWMNENAMLMAVPVSRVVRLWNGGLMPVRGTFFFMGHTTDGRERSLTDEELLELQRRTSSARVAGDGEWQVDESEGNNG